MSDFHVFDYVFPGAVLLVTALVLMARRPSAHAPVLVLLFLWVFVFAAHWLALAFDMIALFPSGLVPNALVMFSVLTVTLSYVFWRRALGKVMGTAHAGIDMTQEWDGAQRIPRWIQWALVAFAAAAVILMMRKAAQISETSDIFGSMQLLRTRLNYEDASWGLPGYLGIPVTVFGVYMVTLTQGQRLSARLPAFLVIIAALAIAVISTQRTSLFMIAIALTFALSRKALPSLRIFSILGAILIGFFLVVGVLVGKVGQEGATLGEILVTGLDKVLLYLLTPLSAFDASEIWKYPAGDGAYSLRFFISLFHRLGLYSGDIQELVMEFIWVPLPTNVYTFAYVPISDFGMFFPFYHAVIGALLGFVFALPRRRPEVRVLQGFMYYPILMTFFQDQFLTITSTWLQILIVLGLCRLLTRRSRRRSRAAYRPQGGAWSAVT
ncbi:MAG: oligosaccharide repeat unit polymerase [Roseivivax sp.]|nr:oligosaccharide repeat unit polymerase [Roseivivax sp.]